MKNHHSYEPSRSEITEAWYAGVKARRDGVARSGNPFIGKISVLAKEWDAGWAEG